MEMKLKVSFDFPFWKKTFIYGNFYLFMHLLVYSFVHLSEMKLCFFFFISILNFIRESYALLDKTSKYTGFLFFSQLIQIWSFSLWKLISRTSRMEICKIILEFSMYKERIESSCKLYFHRLYLCNKNIKILPNLFH